MTLRSTGLRLLLAVVVCAIGASALVVGVRAIGTPDLRDASPTATLGPTRAIIASGDEVALPARPIAVRRDLVLALTLVITIAIAASGALATTARAAVGAPPPLATGDVRLPARRGPPLALPR